MAVSGVNEPTQEELADFSHFSCVLAHEYFGDLASGKIFTKTKWRPSVSTLGRGSQARAIQMVVSWVNEPAQEELADFFIFRVY